MITIDQLRDFLKENLDNDSPDWNRVAKEAWEKLVPDCTMIEDTVPQKVCDILTALPLIDGGKLTEYTLSIRNVAPGRYSCEPSGLGFKFNGRLYTIIPDERFYRHFGMRTITIYVDNENA